MGSLLFACLLLRACFCRAAQPNMDFLKWDDLQDKQLINYQKGFPPGSTIDSLLPPVTGFKWSDIFNKLKTPGGIWGQWDTMYYDVINNPELNKLTKDQKTIGYIFLVCEGTMGEAEPYCPRPCLWDSPCERIPHAVADGCIQMERALYTTNYLCACESGYVWDNNKRNCQRYDVCPANPCQANQETECDVSYEGYDCRCVKERTTAGTDTYSCSCNDPLESQFKWTSHPNVYGINLGLVQGVLTVEECKRKCQYQTGCPLIDYRPDLSRCWVYNQTIKTGPTYTDANMHRYTLERSKSTETGKTQVVCLCSGGKCDALPEWAAWGEWGPCEPLCATSGNKWRSRQCMSHTMKCTGNRAESEPCEPASCLPGAEQSDSSVTLENGTGNTEDSPHKEDGTTSIAEDGSKKGGTKNIVVGIIVVIIAIVIIGGCIARCRKKEEKPEVQLSSTEVKTKKGKTEHSQPLLSKTSRSSHGSAGTGSSSKTSQSTSGSNRNMSNSHNLDRYAKVRHDGFRTYKSIYDDPRQEYFATQYDKNVRQSMSNDDGRSKASLDHQFGYAVVNKNLRRNIKKQMDSDNQMPGNEEMRPEQMQCDEYGRSGPVPYTDYSLAGTAPDSEYSLPPIPERRYSLGGSVSDSEYSLPPIPEKRYSLGGPVSYNDYSLSGPVPDDKYSRGGPVPYNDYSLSGPVPDDKYSRGGPVPYKDYSLSGPVPDDKYNDYTRSAQVPNDRSGSMPYDDYSKVNQVSHDYGKAGQVDGKGVPVPYDDYYQSDQACSSHGSLADYACIRNRVTPYGVNNMNSSNSNSGISKHHTISEHISDELNEEQKKVQNSKKVVTRGVDADFKVNAYQCKNEARQPRKSDAHAARHSSKSRKK